MNHFAGILDTITPEQFVRQYWEREPFVLANDGHRYKSIFTPSDFEYLVNYTLKPQDLVVNLDNKLVPTEQLTTAGKRCNDIINKRFIQKLFKQRSTLIAKFVHNYSRGLHQLCSEIEAVTHQPCQANLYFTTEGYQAFPEHYDNHCVIIMQIDGRKTWHVREPAHTLPITRKTSKDMLNLPDTKQLISVVLQPGDLLYVPRGFIHEVYTEDSHSLHISLGINTISWIQAIKSVADGLVDEELSLRKRVNSGEGERNLEVEYESIIKTLSSPRAKEVLMKLIARNEDELLHHHEFTYNDS